MSAELQAGKAHSPYESELRRRWSQAGGSIPDDWKIVTLESLLKDNKSIAVGVMYPGPDTQGGTPLIKVGDIKGGLIPQKPSYCISPETNEEHKRTKLIGDELLITLVGNPGECVVVTPAMAGWNPARAIAVIRLADPSLRVYLKTVLESAAGKHLIDAVLNTTVQKTLNLKDVRQLPVPMPRSETIRAISSFSEALSDRIGLLRETNATLEAMAQALFKSWFVDFDPVHANAGTRAATLPAELQALFPSTFTDTPQGPVPEGWRVGAIKNACKKVESGGTPKRNEPDYWGGDVPWLSSGEVRNPIVLDTKEAITQLGVAESSAKLWPAGSTIVAMYGATAGEVCLLANPSTANQACCGLIPENNARAFVFFCIRRERENLAAKSSGSAQQNLNKGLVESHEVILPSDGVLSAFEYSIGTLLDSWIENEKQAQTLATLRDTLLPRLISGQLRLPDAEAALAEAGA